MATAVEICNLALSSIGKATINDLNEPIEEARQCNLHFHQTRRSLFSGNYPWAVSRRRQALVVLANDNDDVWAFCYSVPNGMLRMLGVEYLGQLPVEPIPYEIVGEKLYCNIEAAFIRFVVDVEDIAKLPPTFVEAYWSALAARIAFPLTKDKGVQRDAAQIAVQLRSLNEASDANNDINMVSQHSEYYEERLS
jgi:hypothetical protein